MNNIHLVFPVKYDASIAIRNTFLIKSYNSKKFGFDKHDEIFEIVALFAARLVFYSKCHRKGTEIHFSFLHQIQVNFIYFTDLRSDFLSSFSFYLPLT